MQQEEVVAHCNCGHLRARCDGAPATVSVCHCRACKRRTGSAFSYNATFRAEQVRIEGEFRRFRRVTGAGLWSEYNFCPDCGSTVFYSLEERPGMISVPAGAFADSAYAWPATEILAELRQPWCRVQTGPPTKEAE